MILKRFIINLFIDVKTKLFLMLDDQAYLSNNSRYITCLTEIMEVLRTTLSKIEDIYYRHILFPKLSQSLFKGKDHRAY
jgi:hypothetical protein